MHLLRVIVGQQFKNAGPNANFTFLNFNMGNSRDSSKSNGTSWHSLVPSARENAKICMTAQRLQDERFAGGMIGNCWVV